MRRDFLLAISQLAAEKNLPKEVVFEAVEAALVSAYRKDNFAPNQNIAVEVVPQTGDVRVFVQKTVVEDVTDPRTEVSLVEARRLKPDVALGEGIMVESALHNAGRIAAQTAKQVVLQRLREAEREKIFEEFADKESDIVSGVIQRIEPKQLVLDLGRTEAILPASEQVPTEHYRVGQRLKGYLLEVHRTTKGPQVVISRTHRNLLRRLFELEVPEIFNGAVEIKAIAREPGSRSKVAVHAVQPGVDPVGSCIGLRGIRIQNIVNELQGERVDVIEWNPDPAVYVGHALSPAQVISVDVVDADRTAYVVVPDRQLSLAIGREGQNARLAAKLTGLRVDIKSQSATAEERAAREAAERARAEAEALAEAMVAELAPEETAVVEPPPEAAELVTPLAAETAIEMPSPDVGAEVVPILEDSIIPLVPPESPSLGRPRLRFAEELFAVPPPEAKGKKAKSKTVNKNEPDAEARTRVKKGRQPRRDIGEDELLEEDVVELEWR